MSRMTITVDDVLLREAQKASGSATKTETIRVALEELLRKHRLAQALGHRGAVDLDLDQATLRQLRGEA
jgi:Arc/MetJ family transcription regulator